jgi:hypothetical protein
MLRRSFVSIAHVRFPLERPRGSGHPDPDFMLRFRQHSPQPCRRSTKRKKAPCNMQCLSFTFLDRLVDGAVILKLTGRSNRAARARPVPEAGDTDQT